ncbi:MAG: hypothetical protein JSV71_02435 [Nitrospiraceae bacterium]|nr:MAG: hypothetical protein JSV71_02435 [Nitrospiraceae bacterium]
MKKVKSTAMKKSFQNSHEEVWNNMLYILAQHAVIIASSKESGIISYIDIDGVFFSGVLNEDQFLFWEFPFTVWVESDFQKGLTVYIYPMTDFYPEKTRRKSWWDTVETGFYQKSEKFLETLSVQLAAQERWPWLDR